MAGFYIGKFERPYDANIILERIQEIGKSYGYVTLADVHDLIGDTSKYFEYCEYEYGWALSKLRLAYVGVLARDVYSIHMPECDWFYDEAGSSTAKPKEKTESEPINITIPADKPDGIKQAINTLFDNLERIKDHQIFINII